MPVKYNCSVNNDITDSSKIKVVNLPVFVFPSQCRNELKVCVIQKGLLFSKSIENVYSIRANRKHILNFTY